MSKYKSISKRILKSFVLFFIIFSITKLGYSYEEVNIGNGETKEIYYDYGWRIYSKFNIEKGGTLIVKKSMTAQVGNNLDAVFNNAGLISLVHDEGDEKNTGLEIYHLYKGYNGKIELNENDSVIFQNSSVDFPMDFGTTEIIWSKEKGGEKVIDDIEKFEKDLSDKIKDSVLPDGAPFPVVIIHKSPKNHNAFIGKIRTTGSKEMQLYFTKIDTMYNDPYFYGWTSKTLNENQKPIFSQTVPAYSLMPKANTDLAFDSLRPFEKSSTDLWVRVLGSKNTTQGSNRFSMKSTNYGIQVGKNFNVGSNILGGYLTYQQAKTNFEDKYRAENGYVVADKNTGTGKTSAISLGLTATREIPMGVKLDLIGQMTILNNKYNARDGIQANNKGVDMLVSGEVRKPFNIRNNIVIEPQAQLIYQKLKMKDFTDGYRKVNQGNGSNIRARIGTKISYEDNSQRTYYARINLWQNLINTSKTHIGKDVLEEKYGKNSMDIGLGVKMPIFERGNIYGDITYNKSLGNGKNDTTKATIGIDYRF